MNIGERIKQRRTELGWSQRDLAEKMNYSNHSTVGKIETGKVDIPQSRIVQFAEVLGVTVAYLMNWEEVQQKNSTLADITVRMRTDNDFFSLMKGINELNPEELASIKQIVDVMRKG